MNTSNNKKRFMDIFFFNFQALKIISEEILFGSPAIIAIDLIIYYKNL